MKPGLLFSYYGDDFTGSTDVMESLVMSGVPTVLFTRIPTKDEFSSFRDMRAVGLAGTSRSRSPRWMDENLPSIFQWLKSLEARICHYKICSTFDSSPQIGSIGRALEIGGGIFNQRSIPLLVGAPQLKRYTAFGHLFASYQGQTYRIDRHPVMSRHPVTPMTESDLRLHLALQTDWPMSLVPANILANADQLAIDGALGDGEGVVLYDVLDLATQVEAGRQILKQVERTGPFVVGSSGVSYAVMRALAESGANPGIASFSPLGPISPVLVVSGSCSPTTARQLRSAMNHGFCGIRADAAELAGQAADAEIHKLVAEAIIQLKGSRSVLVYTAMEADSDSSQALDAIPEGRNRVGSALGRILRECVTECGLKRVVIAGGDTSSHALAQLDVFALTVRFPLKATPGSPVCIGHSRNPAFGGLEIAMKGGQVGSDDYFVALRDGLSDP